MDTLYAGAYWLARKESAEQCAQRAAAFFHHLSRCAPIYERWFEKGRSREDALNHPFLPTIEAFQEAFSRKRYQSLDGFRFGAWTGHEEGNGGAVNFFCGASTHRVPGNCLIYFPGLGPETEQLLTTSVMTQVLRAMALAWEPEWGVVISRDHRALLEKDSEQEVLTGWVTYLSDRRGQVPPLPSPVRVERVDDLGSLIILTPERFSVSNSEHLTLATHVHEVLEGAGLFRPLEPIDPPA